jgi:hypothetical protein
VRPGSLRLPVSHPDAPSLLFIIHIWRKIVTTFGVLGDFGMRDSSALGLVTIPATVFYAQNYLPPYHEHCTLLVLFTYALHSSTNRR